MRPGGPAAHAVGGCGHAGVHCDERCRVTCLHTDTLTHRHDLDKVVQPRNACCSSRNLFYFLQVEGFMVKIVSSIWSYRYVTSFQKKAQIIRLRYVATTFGTYLVVVIWVFDLITNSQLQVETISTQPKSANKPDPTVNTFFSQYNLWTLQDVVGNSGVQVSLSVSRIIDE